MIIYTAKLDRGRLVAGGLGALALVCVLAALLSFSGRDVTAGQAVSPKGVKTAEDRLSYLSAYGWLVREEPLAVEELAIPKEMGAEYADYLDLQSQQGFDLARYAGKTVKRYTYEILNYPTGETGVQVSLLMYKNTVVGADVLSPALDGFIHGLAMPQSAPAPAQPSADSNASSDLVLDGTNNATLQEVS